MEIATGYFAQVQVYGSLGYAPVSIALKQPWFMKGRVIMWGYSPLAPTRKILDLKGNPEEYTSRYQKEILDTLEPAMVYRHLKQIASDAKTEKVVLLCWEGIGKFCHRHIVANWLSHNLGKPIEEVNTQLKEESLF